jgi:large subunit ribosomal protein L22
MIKNMIYKNTIKFLRISPRKIRFIVPEFKGKNANQAVEILALRSEKAAKLILKALNSALAAAKAKDAIEEDLTIVSITVDEGPRLKRRLIKPRGRADLIFKRMSHLTLVLKDKRKRKKKKDTNKI